MIDFEGYRANVGIILANAMGQVFWAKRIGQNAWQFPQGGIAEGETAISAMYRELYEEIGLERQHIRVLASTEQWLKYDLPYRYVRQDTENPCIGQKQKWFLLQLLVDDTHIRFDATSEPEFDGWIWANYWYPLGQVIDFKQDVYRRAMLELAPKLPLMSTG